MSNYALNQALYRYARVGKSLKKLAILLAKELVEFRNLRKRTDLLSTCITSDHETRESGED